MNVIDQSTPHYHFDILVVGAGHAGTEAAAAAARMGAKTALLTSNLDTIGVMSCNPAIGGVGKGQIVREIDALGGLMGEAIDATGIQFRMLNRRKGPAMHGPRAQADKAGYHLYLKHRLENTENLTLRQETAVGLVLEKGKERPRVAGVRVMGDVEYRAKAVILTTGTFLEAILHYGEQQISGGRAGESAVFGMSGSLKEAGIKIARFKTGTPPRLNSRSIDFSKTEIQPGDDDPKPFSFLTEKITQSQIPCWITFTNEAVHDVIRANLDRAPMYSGQIQSTGPRYCPSIETKIVRFADKSRHQLFLEPEGRRTNEIYVNGLPTSLPRDVQDEMVALIPGLEHAEIVRYGYAIEYDFAPPEQLRPSLETKAVEGLYLAGQINGTTGYEEAGGQGLIAGASAALALRGEDPLILRREEAYLGVMVDDLITKGVDEPYRMFTSRAEYRLRLRQDNADRRLSPIAWKAGLIGQDRYERLQAKEAEIAKAMEVLERPWRDNLTLAKLLRRPETTWEEVASLAEELAPLSPEAAEQTTWDVKYSGYIKRQETQIERSRRWGDRHIPDGFDYASVTHLRMEAREKLARIQPRDLGQAGRISGITPADLAVLAVHLEGRSQGKGIEM